MSSPEAAFHPVNRHPGGSDILCSLLSAEQATNKRQAGGTTTLLLLLLSSAKSLSDRPETQSAEQLVNSQTTKQPVYQSAKTQTIQQTSYETQNTREQQPNGSNDLEQRLCEQRPQWVELLLCMWHVLDLLLGVVDGCDDSGSDLLEQISETVFLWRSLASASTALGLGSDAAVRIETSKSAVAFLENAATFLDERLDVIDKLFFVEFVARGAIGLFDVLRNCQH